MCLACRGSKLLCGLSYCPIIVRAMISIRAKSISRTKHIYGSSPPSVFVGRYGYPKVFAGPSAPPQVGDTRIYDMPESWVNRSLEEIFSYRFSLITGRRKVDVHDPNDKLVMTLQEIAMASRPADVELVLKKAPSPRITFDGHLPPQGPIAPLEDIVLGGNVHVNPHVEKAYYDTDLKASNAVLILYSRGVPVTSIQKILSVGGLGLKRLRRLVPTRWSITAVDDMISKELIRRIRSLPMISEYLVFVRRYLKNLFIAILAPRPWSFEWMEGWFPQTTWNPSGLRPEIMGDYEGFRGRRTYPEIGGCYYASRLAVAEYLTRIGGQATAVLIREIYPGFYFPIGVWFVRENIRELFKSSPLRFDEIREAMDYLSGITRIDFGRWIKASVLLRRLMEEQDLLRWCRG